MHHKNTNKIENQESRKKLPRMLAPAAAALLLTAACGSRPPRSTGKIESAMGPAPTTATADSPTIERAPYTPLTPEQKASQNNLATQAEVNKYAAKVLQLFYNRKAEGIMGDSEYQTKTGDFHKEVIIQAPAMLYEQTGETGEYDLGVTFAADANGDLDPTNPTAIYFTSLIHSPTEGGIVQYQIGIEQSVSGANWNLNIVNLGDSDNGIPKTSSLTTGSEPEVLDEGRGAVPTANPTPLTRLQAEFDRLNHMVDLAEQGSIIHPAPPLVEMR